MKQQSSHTIYTAADIEKYWNGQLTPDQMHAMEMAALDDALLAEAMDGYHDVPAASWQPALEELHQRFNQNQSQKNTPVIPIQTARKFGWLKAAAAVLVVITGIGVTYIATRPSLQSPNNPIANNQPPANTNAEPGSNTADSIGTAAAPVTLAEQRPKTIILPGKGNVIQQQDATTSYYSNIPPNQQAVTAAGRADSNFVYKPSPTPAPATSSGNLETAVADDRGYTVKEKQEVAEIRSNEATNGVSNKNLNSNTNLASADVRLQVKDFAKKAAPAPATNGNVTYNNLFTAQVLASDNTPLPFANISVIDENTGTYADVKGKFRLASVDSTVKVEVRYDGYQPKTIVLNSKLPLNKIVLLEDAADKVTAFNKSKTLRRKAMLQTDSLTNAEPSDGWNNYNTYLANNINFSNDILKKNIHGEVEVSFEVEPNGAITNVKVDKSLCDDCDEEAIRLVKQGPQWKNKKGKKGKARVTISF